MGCQSAQYGETTSTYMVQGIVCRHWQNNVCSFVALISFQAWEHHTINDFHTYANPRTQRGHTNKLKRTKKLSDTKRYNTNRRNKRLKQRLMTVKAQLEAANQMNDALREELEQFEGR